MKKIMASLLIITAFLANVAWAEDISWNRHQGLFTEINAGTNLYYAGLLSSDFTVNGGGVMGEGWSAAVGYNFVNYFGLEAGFMQNYATLKDFHDSDDNDDNDTSSKYGTEHLNIPYMTLRFNAPIGNNINFIGKVGAMYASESSVGGIALPFVGVGFSYAITPNVDVEMQYQGAVYGVVSFGLLSGGLAYHFD